MPSFHDPEPSTGDESDHGHFRNVWVPTVLRSASEPPAPSPTPIALPADMAPRPGDAVWNSDPAVPEPPWRAAGRLRMVGLAGESGDRHVDVEIELLREAAAATNERLDRQDVVLDRLSRCLADARRHATAEEFATRQDEHRIAELEHELTAARQEIHRLRLMAQARADHVAAQVDEHHRSLVASLRMDRVDDDTSSTTPPSIDPHGPARTR